MQTYTPEQVRDLLTQACKELRNREFRCGAAVMAELEREVPEAAPKKPVDFLSLGVIPGLTSVPIIPDFPLQPAKFRLIRHDACEVVGMDVDHSACPATEGEMDAQDAAAG